ncbi:hypothetical protein STSP2_00049 [Anaerohalosphaera lusitana]|uniref:Uncharacterized protein n=1 Tax=Anaerohalosphaera lusitana TaxID=1936003 RepID=A0A1U9NG51_9BACT|nr:hypothetical protein [Anaerohalosphaera lusitana]AQT66911.1 hypothetical protein STSP2_00049 [Anaerohalosphaera lusitana]
MKPENANKTDDLRDIEPAQAVACLEKLLQDQLNHVHQDDDARSSRTTTEAAYVAEFIAENKVLERDEFNDSRQRILNLYRRISAAMFAQKEKTLRQLTKVSKGHKAVSKYNESTKNYR